MAQSLLQARGGKCAPKTGCMKPQLKSLAWPACSGLNLVADLTPIAQEKIIKPSNHLWRRGKRASRQVKLIPSWSLCTAGKAWRYAAGSSADDTWLQRRHSIKLIQMLSRSHLSASCQDLKGRRLQQNHDEDKIGTASKHGTGRQTQSDDERLGVHRCAGLVEEVGGELGEVCRLSWGPDGEVHSYSSNAAPLNASLHNVHVDAHS